MPRDAYEIMIHMNMLEEGIVPYGIVPPGIIQQLKALSKDDSRKSKRKFRKLWKKAYKRFGVESHDPPSSSPSRVEKSRRLRMVYRAFAEDAINHMKDQLE